jgi:acetolactate synthase I/II/III large subunit
VTASAAHALLATLAANGVDRVFLVPGESFLTVLDALSDFADIDVVTCRHEGGAGFMAVADARLTSRPAVVMVSRGPGAANASIALHAAQQDAVPLVMLVGQSRAAEIGRHGFQEIDYRIAFASIAKWVAEPREPRQLADVACRALQLACSGTPGPVVIVVPEDMQTPPVGESWPLGVVTRLRSGPSPDAVEVLQALIQRARRPLIVAGGSFEKPDGRAALMAFARSLALPVAVSFRRHDIYDNTDPLFVGEMGLVTSEPQIEALSGSDLILALGTRLSDATTRGGRLPCTGAASQIVVHCHADDAMVGRYVVPSIGLSCDPVTLVRVLTPSASVTPTAERRAWCTQLRELQQQQAQWPEAAADDGVPFVHVVRAIREHTGQDLVLCLDAGTFAAPVYRHFGFRHSERLLAPLSGAMGYGVPAAIAAQLRRPSARVVCLVGDGGFMMTGNEMIAAVERRLPIAFVLSHNKCYATIRIHQEHRYPGRHRGTTLFNPDFRALAESFGMRAVRVSTHDELDSTIRQAMSTRDGPVFVEVMSSLDADLPRNTPCSARGVHAALMRSTPVDDVGAML